MLAVVGVPPSLNPEPRGLDAAEVVDALPNEKPPAAGAAPAGVEVAGLAPNEKPEPEAGVDELEEPKSPPEAGVVDAAVTRVGRGDVSTRRAKSTRCWNATHRQGYQRRKAWAD